MTRSRKHKLKMRVPMFSPLTVKHSGAAPDKQIYKSLYRPTQYGDHESCIITIRKCLLS